MQIRLALATLLALTAASAIKRHPQSPNGLSQTDASPSPQEHTPSRYYGISLNLNLARKGEQPVYGRAPVELNKLAGYSVTVSEILFDPGPAPGVDVNTVACQAFSDADGTQPLGPEFHAGKPLELAADGQDLVAVASLLCYVSGALLGQPGPA